MNSALQTSEPDVRELSAKFVLQLFDGFTGGTVPVGELSARLIPARGGKRFGPVRKYPDATFVCVGLPPDDYTIEVRSNADARPPTASYYTDLSFDFTVPVSPAFPPPPHDPQSPPIWPGIPDISLADPDLPLDHPRQAAAYLAERRRVTLAPTPAYPFPPDATLVRGTVLDGTNQPPGVALVEWIAGHQTITTGIDGQFVIFVRDLPKPPQITLRATRAAKTTTATIDVRRGMTVALNLQPI